MDEFFRFKRLLFLGASHYQLPAIKKAKEIGCIVITASNNLSEIGHKFSDLQLNISTTDKTKIQEASEKYQIDAIMTYAANAAVETVSYVAEKLKLPCNPLQSVKVLQDKALFREFQKDNGIPHPEFIIVKESNHNNLEQIKALLKNSKLIVKPTDSGGSRGQSIISTPEEIEGAIEVAESQSNCKTTILEKKLKPSLLEIDGDVFFQNGKLEYVLYGHNYFKNNSNYNVPVGEIFPACIDKSIQKQLDEQFKIIIKTLNLTNGCINFDAIVEDNTPYIVDIAQRNGGNFVPEMIKYSSGFNMTEAAIYGAFGRNYNYELKKQNEIVLSYIISSNQQGCYNGYNIIPELYKNILFEHSIKDIGDEIDTFSSGDKCLGVLGFKFNSQDEVNNFIKNQDKYIKINIGQGPIGTIGFRSSSFLNYKMADESTTNKQPHDILLKQFYLHNSGSNCEPKETDTDYSQKHYEANVDLEYKNQNIQGIERLYRRQLVIEPILQCSANCRHCLRQNYSPFILSKEQLNNIANVIATDDKFSDVNELLITGGDPLLIPNKLINFLDTLATKTNNIKTVRIASRLPIHNPYLINDSVIALFKTKYPFRIEMATQINHSAELFEEVKNAYAKIREYVTIYNQTVLLKGINDNLDALINLCDNLRLMGIENHYIFHCVPIKEAKCFRNTINESLKLIRDLTSCGAISGRAKPQLALMTDIGKITLYEGTILKKSGDKLLLQSGYKISDRLKWNPNWELTQNSTIDKDGYLRVWYKDGDND